MYMAFQPLFRRPMTYIYIRIKQLLGIIGMSCDISQRVNNHRTAAEIHALHSSKDYLLRRCRELPSEP